jgi:ribosome-associated protein
MVASTDFSPSALTELVTRAVSMARLAPEDPYCGIADEGDIITAPPTLDIFDATRPTTAALIKQTIAMEAAALAVPGVTNTDEAEGGWSSVTVHLRQSNGFNGSYRRSHHGLSVSVIAGKDTAMERDYDYTSAVYGVDMHAPEVIGQRAGERAVGTDRRISDDSGGRIRHRDPRGTGCAGRCAATIVPRNMCPCRGTALYSVARPVFRGAAERAGGRPRPPRPQRNLTRTLSPVDLRKLQRVVVDALEDVKAHDIKVFNTSNLSDLFDRVIVASGTSNRQTRALANSVVEKVKKAGGRVAGIEGAESGEWVLVDLGDVVVHVLQPAFRAYYNLEELWGGKPVRVKLAPGAH